MGKVILRGQSGYQGIAEGEALVTPDRICFIFDVDVMTGVIHDPASKSRGISIANKIWIFPGSRGSTGGPYGLYLLRRAGNNPKAILTTEADPTVVASAVLSKIPIMYQLDQDPMGVIDSGDYVRVDGEKGIVEITKKMDKLSGIIN